jgi:hypothetical protein
MSRGFKVALVILLPLVVAVICYLPYSPGGRQWINMRIAHQHLHKVEAILAGDSRYERLQANVYTGQDGAIWIVGDVVAEEDGCALMKAVNAEKLPIAVRFDWQVTPRRNE